MSHSSFLNTIISKLIPYLPKSLTYQFAKRYVAGISKESVFKTVEKLNLQGYLVTVDILGEHTNSISESKKYIKLFLNSKMSLTGLRLLSGLILPFTCILYIYDQEIGSIVASCLVVFYSLMCFLWILHSFEDKTLRPKK